MAMQVEMVTRSRVGRRTKKILPALMEQSKFNSLGLSVVQKDFLLVTFGTATTGVDQDAPPLPTWVEMLLSGGDHVEDTPTEGIGAEPEQSCQPEREPEEMQDASERLPLLPIQSQELSQVSDPPVCMRHT